MKHTVLAFFLLFPLEQLVPQLVKRLLYPVPLPLLQLRLHGRPGADLDGRLGLAKGPGRSFPRLTHERA